MDDVLATIRSDRLVAVVRATGIPDPRGLAETLAENGVRCVELTFTIPDVVDSIHRAVGPPAHIGAGTVMNPDQAKSAIDAGASFIVSPACRTDLTEVCAGAGIPLFLGAFTPTEVATAIDAGCAAVKLFPARLGGPAYVKDLRGPFPDVDLIPSGGITEANARAFLDVGCLAVYAGSNICPPALVSEGKLDAIAGRATKFVRAIA